MIDGGAPEGSTDEAIDVADAHALYRLLEEEVVPAYYDRDASHVPRRWLAIVKESIRTVGSAFLRAADGQGIRRADVCAGPCREPAGGIQ